MTRSQKNHGVLQKEASSGMMVSLGSFRFVGFFQVVGSRSRIGGLVGNPHLPSSTRGYLVVKDHLSLGRSSARAFRESVESKCQRAPLGCFNSRCIVHPKRVTSPDTQG